MSPLPLLSHLGRKSSGGAGSGAGGSRAKHSEQQGREEGGPKQQGRQQGPGTLIPVGAANGAVAALPDLEAQASPKAGSALAATVRQDSHAASGAAAAAGLQAPRRGQRRAHSAAGTVGSDTESELDPLSDEDSEDEGGHTGINNPLESGSSRQQWLEQQQEQQQQPNGRLPSAFDGPAQQAWTGEEGATAAGSAPAGASYAGHSVLRRCCVGLLPGVSWQQCSGWCSRLFGSCGKWLGAGSAGDGTHSGLRRSKSFAKG